MPETRTEESIEVIYKSHIQLISNATALKKYQVYELQPYFNKFINGWSHCPTTEFELLYANGTTLLTDNNYTLVMNYGTQLAVMTEEFGRETSVVIRNKKQYGAAQ